jgi:hypothetical protein
MRSYEHIAETHAQQLRKLVLALDSMLDQQRQTADQVFRAKAGEVTVSRRFDSPIPDLQTVTFTLDLSDITPVEAVSVGVDLKHSFVGDLE